MIVGAYTLDLYCDCCKRYERKNELGPHPHQYVAHSNAQAMAQARRDGWTFRNGKCRCSLCREEARSFPKEASK